MFIYALHAGCLRLAPSLKRCSEAPSETRSLKDVKGKKRVQISSQLLWDIHWASEWESRQAGLEPSLQRAEFSRKKCRSVQASSCDVLWYMLLRHERRTSFLRSDLKRAQKVYFSWPWTTRHAFGWRSIAVAKRFRCTMEVQASKACFFHEKLEMTAVSQGVLQVVYSGNQTT